MRDVLQIISFLPVIGLIAGARLINKSIPSWAYDESLEWGLYQILCLVMCLTVFAMRSFEVWLNYKGW